MKNKITVFALSASDKLANDIAEKLGISSNNVSVRLSRIRSKLKKFLKKEGYVV